MTKRELTYIASWLFRNEPENQARFEIYQVTDHKHPAEEIKLEFSDVTMQEINRVGDILAAIKEKREIELKKLKRLKRKR